MTKTKQFLGTSGLVGWVVETGQLLKLLLSKTCDSNPLSSYAAVMSQEVYGINARLFMVCPGISRRMSTFGEKVGGREGELVR